jgi:hypothetical protein
MSGGKRKGGIAHIIAVNMGYGHERPANVMRRFASGKSIIIANDYEGIPKHDRETWKTNRERYEKISRFKKVPVAGKLVFGVMDELQRIPAFYPRRDLSGPSLQLRQSYYLIQQKHLMKDLIEKLAEDPKPILATFPLPAFAAEEFGYPGDIYCLCTDADVSRAWAPLDPKKTRIHYFAPNGRVQERLKLYGVPAKNIHHTGFPLPIENIGHEDKVILKDLQRRLCRLDPNGHFMSHNGEAVAAKVGETFCSVVRKKNAHTLQLAFAVGGAGAQREIGITIAKSLKRDIRQGRIVLHLIAGTRPEVAQYFRAELKELGLSSALKKGQVQILIEQNRTDYFDAFTKLARDIDILWTKPSELSFYAGLGIPVVMAPTVGSQEDFNKHWLQQIGAGVEQLDPRYANEWLFDWVQSGALARMAWHGYIEAPTHGAHRIADVLEGDEQEYPPHPMVV